MRVRFLRKARVRATSKLRGSRRADQSSRTPLLGLQPLLRPESFERRNIGRKTKIKENGPNGRAPSIYQLKEMPPPTSAISTPSLEGDDALNRNDGLEPTVVLR